MPANSNPQPGADVDMSAWKGLVTLVDDTVSALKSGDVESAARSAKSLDVAVRQQVATLDPEQPVPANLLSILHYVRDQQQHAHALSSQKKRDVVKEMCGQRRGAEVVSNYLNHVR